MSIDYWLNPWDSVTYSIQWNDLCLSFGNIAGA